MTLRITFLTVGGADIAVLLKDLAEESESDVEIHPYDFEVTERDPAEYRAMMRHAAESHIFIINIHGDVSRYKKYDGMRKTLSEDGINTFLLCHIEESMAKDRCLFLMDDEKYWKIRRYMQLGGPENRRGLLIYLRSIFTEPELDVPEPVVSRAQGIYHPDMPDDISLEEYMETVDPFKPTVGIMMHHGSWLNGNLEAQNLLIREIEKRGANTIPVFCTLTPSEITESEGGAVTAMKYFTDNGKPIVESIILAAFGFSVLALSTPTDGYTKAETSSKKSEFR